MRASCVFLLLLSGSLTLAKQNETQDRRGARLVVGASEPKHFNPITAVDQPTRTITSLLMADLVHIDRANQRTYPNLAETWEVSEDGRRFTLSLREGMRFSDGHPLDIEDVLFSFRVYLDEDVGAPQRDLLIVEGEPIQVRKLDARRVVFELAAPYAASDRLFDSFYILPQHILETAHEKGELASTWSLLSEPQEIVGLGPFRLKQIVAGERIVLERNPYYWKVDEFGTPLPYLDEVVFLVSESEEAEVLRFRAGETHVIEDLNARDFDMLAADDPQRRMIDLGPGLEHNFMFFNLDASGGNQEHREWFRKAGFRRAIAAAIDRDSIVRLVYGGRAVGLASHVTPGYEHWIDESLQVEPYSQEDAKMRFVEAGFRENTNGRLVDERGSVVRFSLLTNAGNQKRALMASLIQEDLARVGVEVTIASLEFRAYVERILQGRDFDAALLALGGADADPNPQMEFLVSDGGMHVWRLDRKAPATPWEAEIDRLMRAQLVTMDGARRKALYDRVQEIVAEYRPFISLVSPHVLVGAHPDLRNFRPGILAPYTIWNVEELYFARQVGR